MHEFTVSQQTTVGVREATIRTLVPATINTTPYRNDLITKYFVRQIITNADISYVSIRDLISIFEDYFDMGIVINKREIEVADFPIRHSILNIDNIAGIGFLNSKEKSATIHESFNFPSDVSHFTLCSIIKYHFVDR